MLRAAHLPRSQPAIFNLLVVSKRWQQTPTSPGSGTTVSTKSTPGSHTTQYATSNPASATTTQTASTRPSFNAPIDRTNNPYKTTTTPASTHTPSSSSSSSSRTGPPPPFSATPPPRSTGSGGGGGAVVKAVIYSVALGLTATLVYAEYENGSFRRQLESTVPFTSTILGGLDQIIEPVFGRQKPLSTQVSEKLPDLAYVKDKLPNKEQIKALGQQAKDTANNVLDKLPDKNQIKKVGEQVKTTVSNTVDKLPDTKKVKDAIDHTTDQVRVVFLSN